MNAEVQPPERQQHPAHQAERQGYARGLGEGLRTEALFARLGKHSTGKSCLYVKRLDQVDAGVLEQLVALSWERMDRYADEQVAKFREKA